MSVSDVIALVALAVSVIALWRTARHDRTRHIDAVSLFYSRTESGTSITEENHNEIVVRNDGDRSVTVDSVGMAYGDWYTADRNKPEMWALVRSGGDVLLAPGQELRAPAPDDPSEVGIIGPITYVTDANGRRWQKTIGHRIELSGPQRPPRRREFWVEGRPWFEALDARLGRTAVRQGQKRPGRFPWLAILIDVAWGWRAGPPRKDALPMNAPIGWRYAIAADWARPDVDPVPRYSWKGDGEVESPS